MPFSMKKDEISTWVNSDRSDPGFQIMTDDEFCDYVTSEADHQDDEDDSEEQDNTRQYMPNNKFTCSSHAGEMPYLA